MDNLYKEPIKEKILLLVAIFFVAFIVVILAEYLTIKLYNNYDNAISNILSKRRLGRVIIRCFLGIEKNIYKLSDIDDIRDIGVVEEELSCSLDDIESALDVLRNGGTFNDTLIANFDDVNEIVEIYSYAAPDDDKILIEVIDMTPKILDIKQLTGFLATSVENRVTASSSKKQYVHNKEISLLLKQADTYLSRARESANKLFYDSNLEVILLKSEKRAKLHYCKLVYYSVVGVSTSIIIAVFMLSMSQIGEIISERNKSNEELRDYQEHLAEMVKESTAQLEQEVIEHKKTYKALLKGKEFLSTVFDSIQDGISVLDTDMNIIQTNKVMREWYADKVPIEGKKCYEVYYGRTEIGEDCLSIQAFKTGESKMEEKSFIKCNGEKGIYEVLAYPIKNDLKKTVQVIEHIHDITERKQKQMELEKAKEFAEAANHAKSEFLANMSHEIRTPMNGVLGMISLLMDTDLKKEQKDCAEVVKESAESLLLVINDILDISKIETGKLDIGQDDFDIHSMVNDFASMMKFRAENSKLEFSCALSPDVPSFLVGDPGRLRQILTNLVGNAFKFTSEGEIEVYGRVEEETENEVLLHFSIRDTGIGIPDDNIETLFENFTQGDASTTKKYGGTGLGLPISKQLSVLMGGNIGVESEEGKGSKFWFTARLKKSDKKPAILETGELRDVKILLVDDNGTNRRNIRKQLLSWEMKCDLAKNGEEGLEFLQREKESGSPYKVAIIDMRMPGMSGEELGRIIKDDRELKNTVLVMMTSVETHVEDGEMKKTGFSGHLVKPVTSYSLHECLTQVLDISKIAENRGAQTGKESIDHRDINENEKTHWRILLVEDNIINQKVVFGMLKKIGCEVDVAADGVEAVHALENNSYTLVLMDCQMPEMDGYEATSVIRDPESSVVDHDVTVIAVTANAMKGDREKCLAAGMDDYISKPVSKKELRSVIEKWRSDKRNSRARKGKLQKLEN